MADELLRSRHAFGMEENIDAALESGAIDAYDVLFLKDAKNNAKIGWIDKDGNKVIVDDKKGVLFPTELPETGDAEMIYVVNNIAYVWTGEDFAVLGGETSGVTETVVDDKVNEGVATANAYTDEQIANAFAIVEF